MTSDPSSLRLVNPDNPPEPLNDQAKAEIGTLAERQLKAAGVLMQVVNLVGGQVEDGMKLLPKETRARLDNVAARALRSSYDAAGRSRTGLGRKINSDQAHKAIATVSGALGGMGGLPTALVELPIATTMIFRAVQGIAAQYGEDPTDPDTRAQCLYVFGNGGPQDGDETVDTSFLGARIGLTGAALNKLIHKIAPAFAAVMGQKLAGQAVPVLGAAAGAGTNFTFMRYYTEIAHIHFALRQLARTYGEDAVADAFTAEVVARKRPLLRA